MVTVEWSVITVTFNSEEALRNHWSGVQLPSNTEWVVIDNGSRDQSADYARFLGARVVQLPENVGFGAANNEGFRASMGRVVAFVNPDVTPRFEDLPFLTSYLAAHPTDLISPQLVFPDGSAQPNGRGLPYLAHKILNRLARAERGDGYLMTAGTEEEKPVSWLMGAVVIGTRETLMELGPWDPHFFVYYEDSDLGLRHARRGGRSVIVGRARWIHGWARETKSFNIRAWRLELPSLVKFYVRYPMLLNPIPALMGEKNHGGKSQR